MRERPKGSSFDGGGTASSAWSVVGGEAVPATSLDSLVKQVPLSILKDRLRRFLRQVLHTLPQASKENGAEEGLHLALPLPTSQRARSCLVCCRSGCSMI